MRILVANDDGIHSPGIATLARVASRFGDVRVVAPDVEQSSASHAYHCVAAAHLSARHAHPGHRGVACERDTGRLRRTGSTQLGTGRRRPVWCQYRCQPRQRDLALGHASRGEAGNTVRHPRHRAQHAVNRARRRGAGLQRSRAAYRARFACVAGRRICPAAQCQPSDSAPRHDVDAAGSTSL